MKKIIKSRIFLVIITTIIVASASVYAATTYKATDVVYNASDGSSMSVNDALNELYENKITSGSNNLKKGVSKLEPNESITIKLDFEPNFILAESNIWYDEYSRPFYWKTTSFEINNLTFTESFNGNVYYNSPGNVKIKIDGKDVTIQNYRFAPHTITWYIGRYEKK